ncbi:hypothetical protein ACFYZ9_34320 [Streptomyces sp. NPDC001691]|uniref:hypothetical protein n=1 Tax=Streptomyces sp. NPDC001691 TaxID=3364600 RepID=UPI0036810B43
MNEEISRRLREAAEEHRPDRARIVARLEQRTVAPAVGHRRPFIALPGRRAALAAFATAGILATGGLAVANIVAGPAPPPRPTAPVVPPPATSPTPSPGSHPSGTAPSSASPAPSLGSSAPGTAPSASASSSRPTPQAGGRVRNGPVWSEGALDGHSTIYWAQSNLVLGVAQPLTSLTVEMRVAQTGAVRNTGNWRTLPADDFDVTVQESEGFLVYRWVLKPGRTVPPGQHEFASQYNHATGVRVTSGDTYRVDAQTSGGAFDLKGTFATAR